MSIFGAVMVYDGSAIVAVRQGNEASVYFFKQIVWVIIGLILGFVAFRIDYHKIARISFPMVIFSVLLLLLVLIVNHDQEIKRWIPLGPFDLQPSEIAKISFLIYLSSWLAKQRDQLTNVNDKIKYHVKHELLPFLLLLGGICGLILIEPDLDTAVMLGVTSFLVYFLSGSDRIHLYSSLAVGAVSSIIVGLATISAKYRLNRITNYLGFWKTGDIPNPLSDGYQFKQILVAVASGGLFGVGFGQSRQKFLYLGDTAFSDTIFAIFAEEFGLIGCIILLGLFAYIFFKGYKIASKAPDKLGFLIVVSIITWLTFQAILHIGANVALIPINGNTLPFISYGGSSTVINLIAVGVVMNVASQSVKVNTRKVVATSYKTPVIIKRQRNHKYVNKKR
jgi:cell division protein FtsW